MTINLNDRRKPTDSEDGISRKLTALQDTLSKNMFLETYFH